MVDRPTGAVINRQVKSGGQVCSKIFLSSVIVFCDHFIEFQVHKLGDRVYIGLGGFYSDAKTVLDKILFRKNLYELRENRKIKPEVSMRI